ncbi:hypothetical protein, partial [Citrobacter sp. wls758]
SKLAASPAFLISVLKIPSAAKERVPEQTLNIRALQFPIYFSRLNYI